MFESFFINTWVTLLFVFPVYFTSVSAFFILESSSAVSVVPQGMHEKQRRRWLLAIARLDYAGQKFWLTFGLCPILAHYIYSVTNTFGFSVWNKISKSLLLNFLLDNDK